MSARMRRRPGSGSRLRTALGALALVVFAGCGNGDATAAAGRIRLAFVTNCAVEFWTVAEAGVRAAAAAQDVDVLVRMPPNGTAAEQQQQLEDVVSAGVQGVAVSPKDPDNMTALLDGIAMRCPLITHDSDAPRSQRLCYIGVDNYDAGQLCGELIEEAMPNGGPIVLLVGTLDQDNARRRRQGVVDRLLGRQRVQGRFDPQDAVLKNDRFEIRATYTNQLDVQKAKAIVEDCLSRWPDLKGMVGLFEHEPPVILDALRAAGRLGNIAIVGFDENDATLQGIADGHVHGTVVQNPYEYGRRSIELLAQLVRAPDAAGRAALLPADRVITVPARQIRAVNVAEFWADLRQKTGRK